MEHEQKIPVLLRKIYSLNQTMEAVNKQRHLYKRQIKNLSRMNVENNTSERHHVNVQETINNLNQEVINAQEQILAQNKERDEVHNELMEIKAKVYEIMDEMDEAQSSGTEITKEILNEELSIYKAEDLENMISCLDEQIQATATPNIGSMPE